MSWTKPSPGPEWAVLLAESSDSSDEPVLEYYDGDLDDTSAPRSSPPETQIQQQRSPSPVQVAQGQREWHRNTPETLGRIGAANATEDDMHVDVIVISSSEGENHGGDDRPFYYKPTNSHRKKPEPKPKSKSRRNQDLDRRDTIMLVDTVTEATTPKRGKVIFIDPDIIELSDTPDPPPPAPCSRPSRPLPRPLYLARRSPSLPPYESDASPPPRTPRTPHAPPPPRTPLSLPAPTPQSPPKVQLVHSAPQPFRARKSAYLSTYTPTPACASRANARFRHEQVARHVEKGRKESEKREKKKKRDAEANDVIELSDTPAASLDDFDSDPDFAAFEDIVCTPQKRKRHTSHQQSPSLPMSALATPSSLKSRKTVPMKVSKAFTREQYATNSGSWTSSARKSASTAAKTFERKRPVAAPRERNEEW